jgi:hypothetical protein
VFLLECFAAVGEACNSAHDAEERPNETTIHRLASTFLFRVYGWTGGTFRNVEETLT